MRIEVRVDRASGGPGAIMELSLSEANEKRTRRTGDVSRRVRLKPGD
jgi:hypothetical protein